MHYSNDKIDIGQLSYRFTIQLTSI